MRYHRDYQPGSRHLVWERCRDPPPGVAVERRPYGAVAAVLARADV